MSRLVIVSYRVSGPSERGVRAGGLAVAVKEALGKNGGIWFGWSGKSITQPDPQLHVTKIGNITYATLDLESHTHHGFYAGYANATLWPLFHYRLGLIDFDRRAFADYHRVNEKFADALAPMLRPNDTIWVHDYHFIPLGAALRRRGIKNKIGFFLHIPFPVPEILTALPEHETLIQALFDYDLIGFQTQKDARAFAHYVTDEANGTCDPDGVAHAYKRTVRYDAFPIGIDTTGFASLAGQMTHSMEIRRLKESLGSRHLMIGVDRLDYSKGLTNRFEAYNRFLTHYPDYHRKIVYMQIAPLSRSEMSQYKTLRQELEQAAGKINGKYAEFDWGPLRYLNKSFPRQALAAFYRAARIGIVTPLRDGMNLVAKEYVAAQNPDDPGVLILSRFAGAMHELKTGALIVNPFDPGHVAATIKTALEMEQIERVARWNRMMLELRTHTINRWWDDFITALTENKPTTILGPDSDQGPARIKLKRPPPMTARHIQ